GAPDWIDPRDASFGEGRQYFQHNPSEAQKLVAATGNKTPVPVQYFYHNQTPTNAKQNEVLFGMLQEGDLFKADAKILDYNSEWRQVCQQSAGDGYSGFCFNNAGGFNQDAFLVAKYTPGAKYSVTTKPLTGITDLVLQARKELDANKRSAL